MNPLAVYLLLEFCSSLLFSLVFTVSMLYQVTIVHLTPLQLVLMGTILEATVFVCEIPTGVLADVRSRRLSIIVGYLLIGLGFIIEGTLPHFWTVAVAQVVWGLGYTFTSGATQAWIADEIGQDQAGPAFLRGAQAARVGALLAIPIAVAVGTVGLAIPIVVAGCLMMVLAVVLVAVMPETGFLPSDSADRPAWTAALKTVQDARGLVRGQPLLLLLLGIGLFYGLYSEGLDRLWTPHLLQDFCPTFMPGVSTVAWFGLIRAVLLLVGLAAVEIARRHLDVRRPRQLALTLMANTGLIVVALAGFGLTRSVWVALALFWLVGACRSMAEPLHAGWFNQHISDPQVRATLFSVNSQIDAVGQIAGGPAVGALGNASIRMALIAAALILSPALPLYALTIRKEDR